MNIRSLPKYIALVILSAGLAACDPAIHIAWQNNFDGTVDYDCIEEALRAVAPDLRRGSYQSDGSGPRGFDRGIIVTQFGYSDPTLLGYYTLDVAKQPNGVTHYWHEWSKIGTHITTDEQHRVVPLLTRANQSVERRCGLSFLGKAPVVGNG